MNSETAKRRKRDGRYEGEGSGGGEMAVEEIMAEMKAQIMRLQNEVDGMKGRLHHWMNRKGNQGNRPLCKIW